ncbi:MAG: GTPase Era [Deltaproteobacteria bacterium]|nr:GTPase Era [Deltaproteobacteria bacterium]
MGDSVQFRSGFIGIVGAPNVGKSTLLNRVVGQKIAITSSKPQTTRHRILGIAHRPNAQLIFLDTPGIHRAKGPLNRLIVDVAMKVLKGVDLVLWVVDATVGDERSNGLILDSLKKIALSAVLAINKVDLLDKEVLLSQIARWDQAYSFEAIVPISALEGTQVEDLVLVMERALPEGPRYYPEDSVTDVPERFIAGELIREKVFRMTGQEIPYAVAVTVEAFKKRSDRDLVDIEATIHVERESQKPIIIGAGGHKLKRIGTAARKDIEQMVGCRVFLKLWVRVQRNWTTDERVIRRLV